MVKTKAFFLALLKAFAWWGFQGWLLIDRTGNWLFFLGMSKETISSRASKNARKSIFWGFLCRFLHIFDENHCARVVEIYDEPDESAVSVFRDEYRRVLSEQAINRKAQ